MKDRLAFIRCALIPLFIFTILHPKIFFLYAKPIFSLSIFLLFIALNTLSHFYLNGKIAESINPVLNKLFLCFCFILLFLKLGFPKWITYLVLMREAFVMIGWFVFYGLFPTEEFGKEKTLLGQGSFFFQALTIFLYLLYGMNPLTYFFTIVMLTFTLTSLLDYLINV